MAPEPLEGALAEAVAGPLLGVPGAEAQGDGLPASPPADTEGEDEEDGEDSSEREAEEQGVAVFEGGGVLETPPFPLAVGSETLGDKAGVAVEETLVDPVAGAEAAPLLLTAGVTESE